MFAAHRTEPFDFASQAEEWRNVARLLWTCGEFTAMALYRVRTSLRAAHVPLLPSMIHKICVALFGLRIGDRVLVRDGVYIAHANVVIDGVTMIDQGCVITPWATIDANPGEVLGPELGPAVFVGSHATVLGDVSVGRAARIGAGAVVTADVAPRSIVAGNPARVFAEDMPGPMESRRAGSEVAE